MLKRFTTPILLALCASLASLASAAPAVAAAPETPRAGWQVLSNTRPTNLEPGGRGLVELAIFDIGAGAAEGKITVTDVLPAGVSATGYGLEVTPALGGDSYPFLGLGHGFEGPGSGGTFGGDPWECTGTKIVTCKAEPSSISFPLARGGAGAGFPMKLAIAVDVERGLQGTFPNDVTVTGGGALTPAGTTHPITISSTPRGFGFSDWDVWFSNENGTIDTQAGSHPYAATFAFDLNTARTHGSGRGTETAPETEEEYLHSNAYARQEADIQRAVGGDINTIEALLPPGLVGNPHAVPQCTRQQLNQDGNCPVATQLGIISVFFDGSNFTGPLYNMVPPPGAPAEFAFSIEGYLTFLDSFVRAGSDYGITTITNNVPERGVEGAYLTIWGNPSAQSHDPWRGTTAASSEGCEGRSEEDSLGSQCVPQEAAGVTPEPFLTLPTSCAGPQNFKIRADTWEDTSLTSEYSVLSHDSEHDPVGFTGCERLNFDPKITIAPETSNADTPTGLTAEVRPPVGGLTEVGGLSTTDVQNTKVVLPAGVAINPGQAAGLQACGPGEDGLTTEAEAAQGKENSGPADCPGASKVGTVSIETPLLAKRLEGNVYVLQANPPELKLLLAASAEGVNVKLVGTVHLDEATGQLTTTFDGTPELPFTDFKLSFSGGAQAALVTPTRCGTYSSIADFNPWSSPVIADDFEESSFAITKGTDSAACPPSPLPFTPSMIAGATTDQAGGYTDFTMLLQRPDDQQRVTSLQFKTPEGLLGMISRVKLCTNAQAEANACPAASQIGHTVVASGPGPYPLVVPEPGQPAAPIYLTESYEGAPYGLSIVVPLHVGPFTLPTQRVRARIEVDPLTSRLTVTTDPLPQVIGGVPADLRSIDAVIDRPGFMFNPTSCAPMSFSGTATGTEGTSAPLSSPFQMGSCRALLFKPDFKVSTSGKTSRKNGASLDVKLNYPTGALGANQASSQSNIAEVKVDLPRQLPSRLTTLQQACTSQVFEANPAACPAASRVGTVTAVTPVLPVPLTGPAVFVSYGGEKFPELVFILQGYGVTVYVHAETFINKAGITSSTLRHVPDVPISSFELKLPEGHYSALAANGALCQAKLTMPTAFTGQNGAVIHQTTPINVTGCPKKKAAKHKVKKAARKSKQRKR